LVSANPLAIVSVDSPKTLMLTKPSPVEAPGLMDEVISGYAAWTDTGVGCGDIVAWFVGVVGARSCKALFLPV
jgi:hypothetical protein